MKSATSVRDHAPLFRGLVGWCHESSGPGLEKREASGSGEQEEVSRAENTGSKKGAVLHGSHLSPC